MFLLSYVLLGRMNCLQHAILSEQLVVAFNTIFYDIDSDGNHTLQCLDMQLCLLARPDVFN